MTAATSKQVKGKANKVAGSAKKAVGKATKVRSFNPRLLEPGPGPAG